MHLSSPGPPHLSPYPSGMDTLKSLLDLFLHLKDHLKSFTAQNGPLVYALLFGVIFAETGLVVTPFLPGDSLLFAVGAVAAIPDSGLNAGLAAGVILAAAFLGDNVNYWVGKLLGRRLAARYPRLIKPEHLARTEAFFTKYGGKTIILARFVPIVRTFTPFVAGMGAMDYPRFLFNSVVASLLWVGLLVPCGWYFGGIPIVKKHFELVVIGIVFVSILPMVVEYWKARKKST